MNGILFIIITFFYCINVYMLEERISKLENKLVKITYCPNIGNNFAKMQKF